MLFTENCISSVDYIQGHIQERNEKQEENSLDVAICHTTVLLTNEETMEPPCGQGAHRNWLRGVRSQCLSKPV